MAGGWIKLHRSLLRHRLWQGERFTKGQAWVDLLLRAAHEDQSVAVGVRHLTVRRGQVLTSQVELAQRWRWNRRTVRHFLRDIEMHIETDIETSRQMHNGYTVITIRNYNKYQGEGVQALPIKTPDALPIETDIEVPTYKNKKEIIQGTPPNGGPAMRAISARVIGELNVLTGHSFRPTAKHTVRAIRARLAEGYTEDDLLAVVRDRVNQWQNSSEMRKHLCPETLFRPSKFEKYHQAATHKPKSDFERVWDELQGSTDSGD